MRRILLISLAALVLVIVTGAGVAWYLLNDEDFLKARVGGIVHRQTGRELNMDGPLNLSLGRQTTIEARDIRFQNAPWAESADMVSIGHLRVVVDVPSLFGGTPDIRSLLLEDCDIRLQKNEAGEANWEVLPEPAATPDEPPTPAAGPPVLLLDTQIRRCALRVDAPARSRPLAVEVDELDLQLADEVRWRVQGAGRVNDEALLLSGELEPAGALLHGEPVRWDLDLTAGQVTLRSSGSVEDPRTGRGADLGIHFSGPEMALVLDHLGLPALSEGAFDFRLELESENHATGVQVDGDLGSLMLHATGLVDRLVWPQSGALQMTGSGPDLQALGEALGVHGLAPAAYDVAADLSFDGGVTRARSLTVQTPNDRVELAGVLGRAPEFAASDLTIAATTGDIGRWRARTGLPEATVGSATLEGALQSDASGRFAVRANLDFADSTLGVEGTLGTLRKAFEPELDFSFESPDAGALAARFGVDAAPTGAASARGRVSYAASMIRLGGVKAALGEHRAEVNGVVNPARPFVGTDLNFSLDSPDAAALGRLFGQGGLPAAPLAAHGRVSRPDQRLRFDGLKLDLGAHEAMIEGHLNPASGFAGSDLKIEVDSPDVAALASLFGVAGLPVEALDLSVSLVQEGDGLRFRTSDGTVGEIALDIDGRIADLDEPFGVDANFDIRLPSLKLLGFLAPDVELPDRPMAVRGQLRNQQDRTRLEGVRMTLGTLAAEVSGDLFPDRRFALNVDVRDQDFSILQHWFDRPLPAQPFSLRASLEGDAAAIAANGIDARLGASDLQGELRLSLAERKAIHGRMDAKYLDLSAFLQKEPNEVPPVNVPPPRYVFDETPVVAVADPGIDLDLDMRIARLDLANGRGEDIDLGIRLADRRLELNPIAMRGQAGGTIAGSLVLDGSGDVAELRANLAAQKLRLGLSAAKDQDIETFPPLDIAVLLEGRGVTQREMASSLNGVIRYYGGKGQIASSGLELILSDFLTELFNTLNPFAEKEKYTTMECSVAAATIVDGRLDVYPVVFQTEQLTILSRGVIDLHTEKIDLAFNTKPRQGLGLTAGTLINPLIKVGGRLAAPAVELDPAGAAVSGGLAVATAGLSLLAKSTYDRFLSSKDPCGDALREIEKIDSGE